MIKEKESINNDSITECTSNTFGYLMGYIFGWLFTVCLLVICISLTIKFVLWLF